MACRKEYGSTRSWHHQRDMEPLGPPCSFPQCGQGDMVAFRGDHVSLVTTRWQSRHRNTPPPQGDLQGAARFPPVQVTPLGGRCHGSPWLGQPHSSHTRPNWRLEHRQYVHGNTAQAPKFPREKESEEGAQPACGSSAAGWKVPENTQNIQEKLLPASAGVFLVALPVDFHGTAWRSTGSLVQTPSKPWWNHQRHNMKSVGRTKGHTVTAGTVPRATGS